MIEEWWIPMHVGWLETLFLALALGCDAFAVGLGVGTRYCTPSQVFRLSFNFGLFQFIMPLIGWYLGENIVTVAQIWGPWVAFGLLFFLGLKMIYESFRSPKEGHLRSDPTRGSSLILLSLATSMDALGVGFSLGMLGHNLLIPSVWIGITAFGMTWIAMKLGNRLSERFGHKMGVVGGVILLVIAFKLAM
jgi:manganese efflux pump family protein